MVCLRKERPYGRGTALWPSEMMRVLLWAEAEEIVMVRPHSLVRCVNGSGVYPESIMENHQRVCMIERILTRFTF